ncbi:retrovirus-related pol polyprotein from transposon TNT 1-94 [Tanacetum coccineum]
MTHEFYEVAARPSVKSAIEGVNNAAMFAYGVICCWNTHRMHVRESVYVGGEVELDEQEPADGDGDSGIGKTTTGAECMTENGHNQCPKLVASRDKEVNMAARDSDNALVCCVKNAIEDRIMDSGASFHATYCKEELERFTLRSGKVRLAYEKTLDIAGVRDVVLKTSYGTSWTLKDVRYIQCLKRRLISDGQLDEGGYHIGFGGQQWKVTKGSLVVARGNKRGSLYMVEVYLEEIGAIINGNILDVRNVDIHFCKPGGLGKQKKVSFIMSEKTRKLQSGLDEMQSAFGIRRVTRLSKAEILHLWTRFMEPASSKEGGSETLQVQRSNRESRAPVRYSLSANYLLLTENGEPVLFRTLSSKESVQWKKAINEDMVSLEKTQMCSLVRLPAGKKASQSLVDHNEIFSPVVKMTTIMLVLSIVVAEDLHLEQLDVKTAFLHGSDMAEFNKPKWLLPLVFELKDRCSEKQVLGYVLIVGVTTVK